MRHTSSACLASSLPDDLLALLFSRRYLTPADLVEAACTCKAIAAASLAALYTHPLIPSVSALHDLTSVLKNNPQVADSVRSVTFSSFCVLPGQFSAFPIGLPRLQQCRFEPKSLIVCINKLVSALEPYPNAFHQLPMPALASLASVCPHLCHVDLSRVPNLIRETPYLMVGLLNLATVLRTRGGSLRSSIYSPLTAVLVNDHCYTANREKAGDVYDYEYAIDVHFALGIDWGRKLLDTHNMFGMNPILDQFTAIVPFRDLVPLKEQPSWAIRDVHLQTDVRPKPGLPDDVDMWPITEWLFTKRMLWAKAGLDMTKDYVFDLSMPGAIQGDAHLAVTALGLTKAVMDAYRLDADRQCHDLVFKGDIYPEFFAQATVDQSAQWAYQTARQFFTLHHQPFQCVRKLTISYGFFLGRACAQRIFQGMADGMPNLAVLDMHCTVGPLDYIAYFLDILLRRKHSPLQELSMTHNVPSPKEPLPTFYRKPQCASYWDYPDCIPYRSPLEPTGPSRSSLKRLSLGLVGPGLSFIKAPDHATLVIHPGLLHGIEDLELQSVQLYVVPATVATPTAPSLVPLNYSYSLKGTHTRVPLQHMTLPRLRRLAISSASLIPTSALFSCLFPHMPNLTLLRVSMDVVNQAKLTLDSTQVFKILTKFPRLECAMFMGVRSGNSMQVQKALRKAIGERFFKPYPRELAPCPRLRYVQVNQGEPIEYFGWVRELDGADFRSRSCKTRALLPTCVEL